MSALLAFIFKIYKVSNSCGRVGWGISDLLHKSFLWFRRWRNLYEIIHRCL